MIDWLAINITWNIQTNSNKHRHHHRHHVWLQRNHQCAKYALVCHNLKLKLKDNNKNFVCSWLCNSVWLWLCACVYLFIYFVQKNYLWLKILKTIPLQTNASPLNMSTIILITYTRKDQKKKHQRKKNGEERSAIGVKRTH